jgi:hypothetical protein
VVILLVALEEVVVEDLILEMDRSIFILVAVVQRLTQKNYLMHFLVEGEGDQEVLGVEVIYKCI